AAVQTCCRGSSCRPPTPLTVRALLAGPSIRVVVGARQQFAGARRLYDVDGAIAPELRTFGIERHEEVQPFTSVGIRHREQRGIGDIEIGLIERDLSEVFRIFLLQPIALELAPAGALYALVFPQKRVNHIGPRKVWAVDDDAIGVSAQGPTDGAKS